ncbi:MAG: DUF4863 family protein [Hyphomicrobiales bacterium]|nr:DUF4863 family protein [Hyphomicrobiales bacterium]
MNVEQFKEIMKPVIGLCAGREFDDDLETELNATFPPESLVFRSIEKACHAAMDAGWMCQHGEGDLRYGRVVKPLPETGGLSIDVVDMVDVAGPHHAHPKGEVCMTMPQNPDARFDGAGAGWCVNPPGSAHSPTVTDGRALVLYLLPDGQIDFSRAG